jgi:uncharacterized protein
MTSQSIISEPIRQPSLFLQAENREFVKEHYSSEAFYIEECDVGLGVFARRIIRSGEIILAFGGQIIDFAETKRRGPWECMPLQIGPNRYFDTRPPGIFVNHSCSPNAGIHNDRDLVALRDIQASEEIRFDYSTTMEEHSFTMRCLCGAPGCRHIIADFSSLPAMVQERYLKLGIVMNFIISRAKANLPTAPPTLSPRSSCWT